MGWRWDQGQDRAGIRTEWGQMDGSGDGMAIGTKMGMRIGYRWDGISWTVLGLGRGDNPVPGKCCRDSRALCTSRGSHGCTWSPRTGQALEASLF